MVKMAETERALHAAREEVFHCVTRHQPNPAQAVHDTDVYRYARQLAASELKYKKLQDAGGTVVEANTQLAETRRQLATAQQEIQQLREMRGEWSKYVQPQPQEAPPTLLEETQRVRAQWEQTIKVRRPEGRG